MGSRYNFNINDSWPFTSLLTAQTISIIETSIFGQLDSIKTIVLTGNDTIIISKNHGIIRYPDFDNSGSYYEIVGYHQGQNSYGNYLPNFWTIYNFNIGDVFCYESRRIWNNGGGVEENNYKIRLEVLEDLSSGDTIKYVMKKLGTGILSCSFLNPNNPPCYYIYYNSIDTLDITYHNDLLESGFGLRNFVGFDPQIDKSFYDHPLNNWLSNVSNNPYYEWSYTNTRVETNFGEGKEVQIYRQYTDSLLTIDQLAGEASFVSGFGIVRTSFSDFISDDSELVGTIKGTDTIGTIFNFAEDLGINEVQSKSAFLLYPNPTSSTFSISTEFDYSNINIINLEGKTVLESVKKPIYQINYLEAGIYIVSVHGQEGVYSQKIIVK